jgi:hypothetical protein
LFSKAQDLAEAQYHVARCYDHGIGTIEDKTKAVHWYTKVCFKHRHSNGTHVQLVLHYIRFITHAVMSQKAWNAQKALLARKYLLSPLLWQQASLHYYCLTLLLFACSHLHGVCTIICLRIGVRDAE